MAHLSIRIPDEDLAFLKAEAIRQNRDVSAVLRGLIRRACDAFSSPLTASAGELKKSVDRHGFLRVLVSGARQGRLLVEPDSGDFNNVLLWVESNLVSFPEAAETLAQPATTNQALKLTDFSIYKAPRPYKSKQWVLKLPSGKTFRFATEDEANASRTHVIHELCPELEPVPVEAA